MFFALYLHQAKCDMKPFEPTHSAFVPMCIDFTSGNAFSNSDDARFDRGIAGRFKSVIPVSPCVCNCGRSKNNCKLFGTEKK